MELVIRGDKIKVTEAMKNYIEEKVGKKEVGLISITLQS